MSAHTHNYTHAHIHAHRPIHTHLFKHTFTAVLKKSKIYMCMHIGLRLFALNDWIVYYMHLRNLTPCPGLRSRLAFRTS